MKNLVIVESPTKARTITKFLNKDYKVESSFGHIRDLPQKELGVDVENNFEPKYEIPTRAQKQVTKLKALAKQADNIILATDEDREGEAISWHLKEILKPKKFQRITFHEITKTAIEKALENPGELDMDLVDAQQARRILDRLVGYKLSPFLWKKVARGLSAGRVQSVAVRLIVEREKERDAFKSDEYWTIEALFNKDGSEFEAKLHAIDGKTLKKLDIKDEKSAKEILDNLKNAKYKVVNVETKEHKKNPPTPFTTSTLQQAANNKLHMSAKQAMVVAQQLYEGIKIDKEAVGLITYMRTDSMNLSEQFLTAAHSYITEKFGKEYAPAKPTKYKTKSKGAQEAHEAIRPTHVNYDPESIKKYLDDKQYKLYKLIWSRTLACQMTPAIMNAVAIDINNDNDKYSFRATGQSIKFDGYFKVYSSTKENILPAMNQNDEVKEKSIKPEQHFTQPPARYTEATLVKAMEEKGIGRPSTYAPTIATVQDRGYVEKEAKALKPTEMGTLVTEILIDHFKDIIDYDFTAEMENDLDKIEEGKKEWQPIIKDFYKPFIKNLEEKTKTLTKKELTEETTDEKCEKCNSPMVIKTGRFGKFMACSNYPDCKNTKDLNEDGTEKTAAPIVELEEECPDCGHKLVERTGRFGKFIGCSNYPKCKYIKKKKVEGTGVKCPKCEKGEIVSKFSRAGKQFYACNNYPKCKNAYWSKPTGEKCPKCKSLIVLGAKGQPQCSNKDCK